MSRARAVASSRWRFTTPPPRDALKENKPCDVYDEKWADERHVEVVADTEDDARSKVLELFPASEGFIITGIEELPFNI